MMKQLRQESITRIDNVIIGIGVRANFTNGFKKLRTYISAMQELKGEMGAIRPVQCEFKDNSRQARQTVEGRHGSGQPTFAESSC